MSPPPPTPDPDPAWAPSPAFDPDVDVTWDDLPDAMFSGLSEVVHGAAEDPFEYDAEIMKEAIRERAFNAPAEPKVEPRVVTEAPATISLEELGTLLWEGLR
jgi:hypothetical protein